MQFRAKFGCRSVATIERDATGVWKERLRGLGYADDTLFETAWHDIEVVDRVGAGDAFAAGVLHGLESGDFGHGIDCGAAAAALQHTVPGDLPGYTKDDVAAVLEGQGLRLKR